MSKPLILPLDASDDPQVVGGKGAGLCRLLRLGFRVPPGFCLTTEAYRTCLRERALVLPQPLLDEITQALDRAGLERDVLLAVRSSATDEDASRASGAGVYRTHLSVTRAGLGRAVASCWASLGSAAAGAYREQTGATGAPGMAVVIQPLLAPRAAGVAFSRHPVTADPGQVAIDAVLGLAEPLVSGQATPDHYVVRMNAAGDALGLVERRIVPKAMAALGTATGVGFRSLSPSERQGAVLSEAEACELAALVKQVEQKLGFAADVEWARDGTGWWLLQARPIAARPVKGRVVWSRANFKETMPDLPSPLGLSFLDRFMDANIIQHYRDMGCRIPAGWSSVRIFHGRPYINVTLFQSFMTQLGGDPSAITEQMGGLALPPFEGERRLPWWRLLRAGLLMTSRMRDAERKAPAWFATLKALAGEAGRPPAGAAPAALVATLTRLGEQLHRGDLTLPIVGGVSQGQSLLTWLLKRRLGPDWRRWLNQALRGVGTIISAKQIWWLAELAEQAAREPAARAFLTASPWTADGWRERLADTAFLGHFDAYLQAYGHRAIGESDPASPRFAEMPGYLLGVLREHLLAPTEARRPQAPTLRQEQEAARAEALQHIRRAFGWRWHERTLFERTYERLCRFLALREANRHHQMYFTAAVRRIERELGGLLAAAGLLAAPDDIFFLTAGEVLSLAANPSGDWRDVVAGRKREREDHQSVAAADTVIDGGIELPPIRREGGRILTGMAISAGSVRGPVRLVLAAADVRKVRKGDIIVTPVIDPGLAPVLGLAGGLVAEMGGTLSHGAIIAREFGLPAVANVAGATRILKDGELIAVDASRGEVRQLGDATLP